VPLPKEQVIVLKVHINEPKAAFKVLFTALSSIYMKQAYSINSTLYKGLISCGKRSTQPKLVSRSNHNKKLQP